MSNRKSDAGKGDRLRPVNKARYDLNYLLGTGRITFEEYDKRRKELIKAGRWE